MTGRVRTFRWSMRRTTTATGSVGSQVIISVVMISPAVRPSARAVQ